MPWLPEDFVHPLRADLPTGHHLRPMGAADTEIDHPAVMGSRERLWGVYGPAWGWPPATMTVEQDREDLAHHERETAAHQSFLYGLFPEVPGLARGEAGQLWPHRHGTDAMFMALLRRTR